MNPLFTAAAEVQDFLRGRGWRFCIIGGLAVIRWGEPRLTQDVDLTLLVPWGDEEDYVREFIAAFTPRQAEALAFALTNRVLLVRASNGVPIDVGLGGIPFEESMVERSSSHQFADGVSLVTCSAEDLVVLKAFAERDQDWLDVAGVLSRQSRLEWTHIERHLGELCAIKEAPEILTRLQDLRSRIQGPSTG